MSSNERILITLFKLLKGENLSIVDESQNHQVSKRTTQRDFSMIKSIAEPFGFILKYHETENKYSLDNPKRLDFADSLAIVKILLASRAFVSVEIDSLLHNIIQLNVNEDIQSISKLIKNELTFYRPLNHNTPLLTNIKKISSYIDNKKIITVVYKKNNDQIITRKILPVSLFFSEYYFYVISYEIDKERYINLRIDRFISFNETTEPFFIPYKDRLEEKDLREKMIFMQYGVKKRFKFKFFGIVEAALDKFPNGRVTKTFKDGSVLIEAEAYDKGVIMWILSQGHLAKIISPISLINDINLEIKKMNNLYR